MSDEKSTGATSPNTVTVPAAGYQQLKGDVLAYCGRAESAEREAAALRQARDAETISAAVRVVAGRVGVRPEALPDAVALLAPALRVEGGTVRVKGSPEADLSTHLEGFFQARPHWAQSPKTGAPGRTAAIPSTPTTTTPGSSRARPSSCPPRRSRPGSSPIWPGR
jgi:hypothetical protein